MSNVITTLTRDSIREIAEYLNSTLDVHRDDLRDIPVIGQALYDELSIYLQGTVIFSVEVEVEVDGELQSPQSTDDWIVDFVESMRDEIYYRLDSGFEQDGVSATFSMRTIDEASRDIEEV